METLIDEFEMSESEAQEVIDQMKEMNIEDASVECIVLDTLSGKYTKQQI